jgi:hypothetical protein
MSPRIPSAFHLANILVRGAACLALITLALATADRAVAQYPGVIAKKSSTPELRAVAVLEWTGEAGKPKACRIVPITIFDGEKLNDAGIYLARPEPLAISGEVEYQLKDNGRTIGLFDIKNTGQEQGSWVGYGEWKPAPRPEPAFAAKAPDVVDDEGDDKPVLHRKKHADDPATSGKADPGKADSGATKAPGAPEDPDRPKLQKKDESASASSDSDAPTLHKGTDNAGTADSASTPSDPDRPVLKKPKQKEQEDVSRSESLPQVTDPDRPRLQRGKSNADNLKVLPSLMGLPEDMQQAVAVSDAQNRPDHPWAYSWANADDEDKIKAQLEDLARKALGLAPSAQHPTPKPTTTAKAVPHRAGTTAKKPAKPAQPPPPPAELQDEQFRVFELSYGSGATLVLTADTGGPLAQEKFVTLVAQPDIYGNLQVLLKNVTDGTHLDETPHMRIVDAVDALADNRGELLFELRGETSRQFALFRVFRGRADKMFVSGGGYFGATSN